MTNPFETLLEKLEQIDSRLAALEQQKTSTYEGYLNVEKAAEVLNLSPASVYRLTMLKQLPFKKVRGRLFFVRKELQQYIESNGKM